MDWYLSMINMKQKSTVKARPGDAITLPVVYGQSQAGFGIAFINAISRTDTTHFTPKCLFGEAASLVSSISSVPLMLQRLSPSVLLGNQHRVSRLHMPPRQAECVLGLQGH